MLKIKFSQTFVAVLFSFSIVHQTHGQSSVDEKYDLERMGLAIAQQMVSDYSQLKTTSEVVAYLTEGKSKKEKDEIEEIEQLMIPGSELPQLSMENDLLILTLDGQQLEIDVRQAYKGRISVDGMMVLIDPKAPLKMQIEVFNKKLEAHFKEKEKFSIFSLLISPAYAKGKAHIEGKNGKKYHRALTSEESKAMALDEKKQKRLLRKFGSAVTKHPILSLLVVGGGMKVVEIVQVGLANGLGTSICKAFDRKPDFEQSQKDVDDAIWCPEYKKAKRNRIIKDKQEREKLAKENKEKQEKVPANSAAATAEDLKKYEIQGVKVSTVRKSCPHERKDGNIKTTIMKITDSTEGEESIDLILLEGTLENKKLKEVRVSEYSRETVQRNAKTNKKSVKKVNTNSNPKLLGIYKFEDSKFTRMAFPTQGKDKSKIPFEEISAVEQLPTNHPRYNDQKLHKQIHNKFQLSYLACADEEVDKEGRKAAAEIINSISPGNKKESATGTK